MFSEPEVLVALELIDEGVERPDEPDAYRFVVAESAEGAISGYACYGSTPNLPATYDLYWIAVDPALHGQGIGKLLIERVEAILATEGGGLVVVETSSRDDYVPTRAFYLRCGYVEQSRTKDYYGARDDKVVYVKRLEPAVQPQSG